jgi:hypothetical protein
MVGSGVFILPRPSAPPGQLSTGDRGRERQQEQSHLEIENFPGLVITALLRCIGPSISSMASVPSIKRESIPVAENICWRCTTAQIDIAKAVAQEEEADTGLVPMTSRRIGRTLGRLRIATDPDTGVRAGQIPRAALVRLGTSFGLLLSP